MRFASRYLIERGIRAAARSRASATRGERIAWTFDNPMLQPPRTSSRAARAVVRHRDRSDRASGCSRSRCTRAGIDEVLIVDAGDRPMPERAMRCADETAALDASASACARSIPTCSPAGTRRLRSHRAAAHRGAPRAIRSSSAATPARCACARPKAISAAARRRSRPARARRHRSAARRVRAHGRLLARRRGARGARRRQGGRRRRARPHRARSSTTTRTICRRSRSTRAPTRGSRIEIVEKLEPGAARVRAQRAHRHDARSRRGEHRVVRLPVLCPSSSGCGIVAPTVRSDDSRVHAAQQGGHVLEPVPGLHANVWVFDFKSLYPSLIRTFNIDPLALRREPAPGDDLIGRRAARSAASPRSCRGCSTSCSRAARRRSAPATTSRRTRSRS